MDKPNQQPRSKLTRRLRTAIAVSGAVMLLVAGCQRAAKPPTPPTPPPRVALPHHTVHVLCYHNVVPQAKSTYDTSVADFEAQLNILSKGGYRTISCAQLADYLTGERDIPDKSVIISFDDGRRSVFTTAQPILAKYHYTATLFLITSAIGGRNSLTWPEVKKLVADGYEVGSHTVSHANLTKLARGVSPEQYKARLAHELGASEATLEKHLGAPTVAVAYPYGNYDGQVMHAVREAGYRLGFSIDPGAIDQQSNPWSLPRTMIVRGTSLKTFQRVLAIEPLHLTGMQPAVGVHVRGRAYTLHARLADAGVTGSLVGRAGKGTKLAVDSATGQVTLTGTLNRGANLVRLTALGSPRREAAWIVICDLK